MIGFVIPALLVALMAGIAAIARRSRRRLQKEYEGTQPGEIELGNSLYGANIPGADPIDPGNKALGAG